MADFPARPLAGRADMSCIGGVGQALQSVRQMRRWLASLAGIREYRENKKEGGGIDCFHFPRFRKNKKC